MISIYAIMVFIQIEYLIKITLTPYLKIVTALCFGKLTIIFLSEI